MLGFAKVDTELIEVEDNEAVQATQKPYQEKQARLEQLEARERRLISVVTGTADHTTQAEYDEGQRQLAIRKGTQHGWYLPEAQEARESILSLRVAYNEAVQRAKAQLVEAGLVKLKALCGELTPVIRQAMQLAEKIEDLRQQVGDCGGDLGEHPCPVLLPGCLVAAQLDLMKAKGLL